MCLGWFGCSGAGCFEAFVEVRLEGVVCFVQVPCWVGGGLFQYEFGGVLEQGEEVWDVNAVEVQSLRLWWGGGQVKGD